MEPIKRNANKMLDTLTGKIPEKLSQENSFTPLPTLEEMNSTNDASSPSMLDSIKNNWLAILAALALIMFTVFNVLAYYAEKKNGSTATVDATVDAPVAETSNDSVSDKMITSFNDVYKYVQDSFAKWSGSPSEVPAKVEKPPATTTNQIPNITAGKPAGKPVVKKATKGINDEEVEEVEEEDPNVAINALDAALANASQKHGNDSTYKANDAYSSVQTVKAKAGWCFVGEERGFRNCVEVGENDKCLSGDIFPTSQVCINPRLRA